MNCLWRSAAFMPIFRSTERMSLIVIRKTEDLAMQINGLHHVTAISGPARRNLDFYARVLGLRLVKKTVNFDDPGTYHLYFGDVDAAPGSILTFFPWEHASPGRLGVGETQETVFRVPEGSIGFWAHRFVEQGVPHEVPVKRFGETVLSFRDPDGMRLALVGLPGVEKEPAWTDGGIPAEHALRGFHSVSLLLADAAPTGAILSDVFGFTEIGREGHGDRRGDRPARRRWLPAGPAGRGLGPPYRLPGGR